MGSVENIERVEEDFASRRLDFASRRLNLGFDIRCDPLRGMPEIQFSTAGLVLEVELVVLLIAKKHNGMIGVERSSVAGAFYFRQVDARLRRALRIFGENVKVKQFVFAGITFSSGGNPSILLSGVQE